MNCFSWQLWRLAWGPSGRRGNTISDYTGEWRRLVWRLWWLTPIRW